MKAAPKFNTTVVIVTKRHSTRFFPRHSQDAMNNNGNCNPGLLVDSTVTSPYFTDFYLQSHNGIKGTARPCHYFVLRNEMAMTTAELEDLVSTFLTSHSTLHHIDAFSDSQPLSHLRPSHNGCVLRLACILCRPPL